MFKKIKAAGKKIAAGKRILSDVQMIRREMKRADWAESIRVWGAGARIFIQVCLLYCRELLLLVAAHHRLIRACLKGFLVFVDLIEKAARIAARKEAR